MVTIGSCASTCAVDVGSQNVKLLAVLVGDDGTSSGTGVGSKCNTTLKHTHHKPIDYFTGLKAGEVAGWTDGCPGSNAILTLKTTPQMVVPVLV